MFNYKWYLKDGYPAKGIEKHNSKVFSCFACGGGSTMGYKLAGYDVIGCNEIDPKMNECYVTNHNPKYNYLMDIREFRKLEKLPDELFNLDILDGSPPCSSFSMAGNREKDWGKEKKFREGQKKQVLDDLFFEFIELGERLQPKIIIAENVKGLLLGEAKKYVTEIALAFDKAGYYVDKWLLDASKMGVPQKRERVFFIAIRKDLVDKLEPSLDMFNKLPELDLEFNINEIPIKRFYETIDKKESQNYSNDRFGDIMMNLNKPSQTIATINRYWVNENQLINNNTKKLIGSYPLDYNFLDSEPQYLIGMSVPPVMTAQIAHRIYNQWLSKL